jgi:hypothetical protein
MKHEGFEVAETTTCMCCMSIASFHHVSGTARKDGKKTVVYRCAHNHTTFLDVDDFRAKKVPKTTGKKLKKVE